jgi:peptide/nickel transport system substrate-binding protein
VRFSDGRAVRALDVRASLERALRVNGRFLYGWYSAIAGAPRCVRTPARCDLSRGIRTDAAARTVTLRLTRPDPALPYKLALLPASVVPAGSPLHQVSRPLPGTGPYRIVSVTPDGVTRLVRNRAFRSWSPEDRPSGYADEIVVRRDPSLQRRIAAVEQGDADVVDASAGGFGMRPAGGFASLSARYPHRLSVGPTPTVDYMFLNVRAAPFDDVRVRRAVNLATDRRRTLGILGGPGFAEPACLNVPGVVPGSQPLCAYTVAPNPAGTWTGPDVAAARRLIAASGTRGMRVQVWTDRDKAQFGRYFAALLRRLGYRSALRILPSGVAYFHTVGLAATRAQIGMAGWNADYPSPATFFQPTFSCRGLTPDAAFNSNPSQLCDRALDRAVARAQVARGQAAVRAWRRAEQRLSDLAPAVPLAYRRRVVLTSTRAGDVQQGFNGPLLERIWVR